MCVCASVSVDTLTGRTWEEARGWGQAVFPIALHFTCLFWDSVIQPDADQQDRSFSFLFSQPYLACYVGAGFHNVWP